VDEFDNLLNILNDPLCDELISIWHGSSLKLYILRHLLWDKMLAILHYTMCEYRRWPNVAYSFQMWQLSCK